MKTLLLNPPSFPNFDGGASSRWPATREIASFWYPVWLAYPAGLIKNSRLLDAPSHGVSPEDTVRISRDYDFAVVFTSTPGFRNEIRLAEMMKEAKADLKIALVGPPVTVQPEESLRASKAVDFVARKEFDYSVTEIAEGRKLEDIQGISFRSNGPIVHNPERPSIQDLDPLPFAVEIISGISTLQSTTYLFCCILTWRFTRRAAAQPCVLFVCGRKRSAAILGEYAAARTWQPRFGGRWNCFRMSKKSSLMMIPLPGERTGFWICARS